MSGLRSLQELGTLREALREREAEAARARAAEEAERRRQEQLRTAFARAVGPVQALPAHHHPHQRVHGHAPRPEPPPRQREADERAALREALSDEVDIESLLLTDDGLSYRRPGVSPEVPARLRRGQWAIQAQVDLHGLRRDEAREALAAFVRQALQRGQRCVRVVHGKGLGSPGREPVLKAKAQRWLAQCSEVIAFTQAAAPQGGAGALVVLLQRVAPR
ncbi:MAG TPA: Smr/MutS family protein [Rubrivivax sp.]|nr:Smr/MutS family protein [Rubrivivax sp.]